jgi:hypothetical protein
LDAKEATFSFLALHSNLLPKNARSILTQHRETLLAPAKSFWGEEITASAGIIALLAAIDAIDDADVIERMLGWGHSTDASTRLECARLIRLTASRNTSEIRAAVALALTHDEDPDVAAAGARAIVALTSLPSAPLRSLITRRIHELLRVGGVAIPGNTLSALIEQGANTDDFATEAEELTAHRSYYVRRLASGFLTRPEGG